MMKKFIAFLIFGALTIITIATAVAGFELDEYEDSFTMKSGQTKEGFLIIDGYTDDTIVETQFEWISFSKNSNLKAINDLSNYEFQENVASIPYYIKVPEDADIGIYRTIISVSNPDQDKYLNLKISVQNGFFTTFSNWYNSLSTTQLYLGVGLISLIIIIFIWFIRKSVLGG